MQRELSRFQPFCNLPSETLKDIARHANLLEVPARRWLVRQGRVLRGWHYLVHGSLRASQPDQILEAGPDLNRAIYPGPRGLFTLGDSVLLQVSDAGMELANLQSGGLATLHEDDDCWQVRFLRSQLMTSLRPDVWQMVLGSLEPRLIGTGEVVLVEGAEADEDDKCFLVARGIVNVSAGGHCLARLGPGELFGEDALISGRCRNATVRAAEPTLLMELPASTFQRFLEAVLISGGFEQPEAHAFCNAPVETIRFHDCEDLRGRIEDLDPCICYQLEPQSITDQRSDLDEKSRCNAALILFLLRKRGLKAWMV